MWGHGTPLRSVERLAYWNLSKRASAPSREARKIQDVGISSFNDLTLQ